MVLDLKWAETSNAKFKIFMLQILALQVILVAALHNSIAVGLPSLTQLWLGLNLIVFAAFFSVYHFGLKKRKFVLFKFH